MIGGAAVLLVIVILIIVITVLAKKAKRDLVGLPKDTNWGSSLNDVENDTVVRLTDSLYHDMKGWNLTGHNKSIYQEYNNTTDKVFVAVANYFAEKYGEGENLAQWIKDESYSFHNLTDSIISRLSKFGVIAK